jgi:ABC-type branched-subunit amino acid transport system ATPase component
MLAGLDGNADVSSLSAVGGRNLSIAVALVCQSPLVLIDGGGDAAGGSTALASSIKEMRGRGSAVVVSVDTEDAELRSACQRLFRLQDGRLVSDAPAAVAAGVSGSGGA